MSPELGEVIKDIVKNVVEPLAIALQNLAVDHNLTNCDIWTETGRTQVEQQEFKAGLINFTVVVRVTKSSA